VVAASCATRTAGTLAAASANALAYKNFRIINLLADYSFCAHLRVRPTGVPPIR